MVPKFLNATKVNALTPPIFILFDWHATLADTMEAMYASIDDMWAEADAL
jgi:phosphoglycolate phosphatase